MADNTAYAGNYVAGGHAATQLLSQPVSNGGGGASIAANTMTLLKWGAALNLPTWFNVSSPTKLTVDRAGWFSIFAAIKWPAMTPAAGNDSALQIQLSKNGTALFKWYGHASKDVTTQQVMMTTINLALNDYLELSCYQNSNAAQSLDNTDQGTSFWGMSFLGGN